MTTTHDLLRLERVGWEALSTSGEAAASFYSDVLATQALMVLPGGMVLDDRDQVIDSMSGEPWESFDLFEERVQELATDCAVVVYPASARRGDREPAWCSTARTCSKTAPGDWHCINRPRDQRPSRNAGTLPLSRRLRTRVAAFSRGQSARSGEPLRQLSRSPVVSVGHVRPGRRGGWAPRASIARAASGW